MVYDRIYDSFEEVVSLYIVNPVKSMEWDNMKLSHEDAMVESNKRETDIAFAIVDKLKEKGFVRLEDKVPESKHYIAHITSHQYLVADEKQYNTLSNDMMDNHVNISVQGFETLQTYSDAVNKGRSKGLPMVQEMSEVLSCSKDVPFLNVCFKVKDKNPIAVMRIVSDVYNSVKEMVDDNKKNKIFTIVNHVYPNEKHMCFTPEENTNFTVGMYLGYSFYTKDNQLDLDKIEKLNEICCKNSQPTFKHHVLTIPNMHEIIEDSNSYLQKSGGQIKVAVITANKRPASCEVSFALPLESMGSFCKDMVDCIGQVDKKSIKNWHFRQGGFMFQEESDKILNSTFVNHTENAIVEENKVNISNKKIVDLSVSDNHSKNYKKEL